MGVKSAARPRLPDAEKNAKNCKPGVSCYIKISGYIERSTNNRGGCASRADLPLADLVARSVQMFGADHPHSDAWCFSAKQSIRKKETVVNFTRINIITPPGLEISVSGERGTYSREQFAFPTSGAPFDRV